MFLGGFERGHVLRVHLRAYISEHIKCVLGDFKVYFSIITSAYDFEGPCEFYVIFIDFV